VQRILKEHAFASVQRLADGSAIASFGAIEEAVGLTISEMDHDPVAGIDVDDDDYEGTDGIDFRLLEDDEEELSAAFGGGPIPGVETLDASGRCRASGRRVEGPDRLPAIARFGAEGRLERDDFSSNRHPALSFCLSMIFRKTGNPLFRIML